ncbi:hypothetical protein [Nostoc sp. CCY0012]|uniref:hypothetical protein n=1 Tax=Nostoc sp. CCY0012 TaxID=1056123 RepID=UPI0039C68A56
MENHSLEWILPTYANWVKSNELDRLIVIPKLYQILNSWFAKIQSNSIPKMRVPWAKLGWFDRASIWINRQLETCGSVPWAASHALRADRKEHSFNLPKLRSFLR